MELDIQKPFPLVTPSHQSPGHVRAFCSCSSDLGNSIDDKSSP